MTTDPSSDVRGNSNTNRRNCLTDAEVALLIEDAKAEAAATIERLSAERMQLREALEEARPFLSMLHRQGEDNIWRPAERHLKAFDAALSNTAENG